MQKFSALKNKVFTCTDLWFVRTVSTFYYCSRYHYCYHFLCCGWIHSDEEIRQKLLTSYVEVLICLSLKNISTFPPSIFKTPITRKNMRKELFIHSLIQLFYKKNDVWLNIRTISLSSVQADPSTASAQYIFTQNLWIDNE